MQTTTALSGAASRQRHRASGGWTIPVLEPAPAGPAARFAAVLGRDRHPAIVFFAAAIGGLAAVALISIGVGFLIVHVVAPAWGVGAGQARFDGWLAGHRTRGRTEASLVGSIAAGGVVLPIVVGAVAVVSAVLRRWRIAAFAVVGLVIESGAYRATTLALHEHRPRVVRLETLPVNASYPSGHTAASIAVYGGLVLLLTSAIANRPLRVLAWTVAAAIPVFVGLSRMYRGMHYPLDVAGGALVGICALVVIVFACRAAGAAESRRAS